MSAYLAENVARARSGGGGAAGADGNGSPAVKTESGAAAAENGGAAGRAGGAAPSSEHLYDLFGVIVHHGTINAGHYTSFVKHCGRWYNCDDAWVVAVTEEEVRRARAYLLFYARRGAGADALDGVSSLVLPRAAAKGAHAGGVALGTAVRADAEAARMDVC